MGKLNHMIPPFDWAQFHFLYPKALWLFLPLALIAILLAAGNREQKKWKRIIPAALRPWLFTTGSRMALVLPLLLFMAGAGFCIVGLAAPTWKKKEVPSVKSHAVVLIALDCSQSMLATDIQPNRLERAKFKLGDFLDANPRARAGLVAFAGSAHPVLPFTGDYRLVKQQATSLLPRIMPIPGANTGVLLIVVDSLLKNIDAPSTIFLMTDAIDAGKAAMLGNYMQGSRHHLEILLFSTPGGSGQDPIVLRGLARDSAITITPLTLDTSDVAGIAKRIAEKLVFEKAGGQNEKEWMDMGSLLLIPALLITLFWFRKGWLIQWCWLVVATFGLASCGIDSKHADWWYKKDYQGQLLENAGRYEEAAVRFEDDRYKAVAWFKAGNYEAAADLFATLPGADAAYDRGLALARSGRYEEAIQSLDRAIRLDPSLRAMASGSMDKIKEAKRMADSLIRYDPRKVTKDRKDVGDKKKKNDSLQERKAQSDDEQLSSDTRVNKLPTSGNRVTDQTAGNIHRGKEAKVPQLDSSLKKSPEAADRVLMRGTVADPAEFLHRRFELQVKRYYKDLKKSSEPR
jgi:Ca-activated chloride channel family protein